MRSEKEGHEGPHWGWVCLLIFAVAMVVGGLPHKENEGGRGVIESLSL